MAVVYGHFYSEDWWASPKFGTASYIGELGRSGSEEAILIASGHLGIR
jgi:hypothetical protein